MRIDGLYLRLVRVEHELGADLLVELLRREEAERNGGLLERGALLVRLLCTLGDICTMLSAMIRATSQMDELS